jgi:hypothetical protein
MKHHTPFDDDFVKPHADRTLLSLQIRLHLRQAQVWQSDIAAHMSRLRAKAQYRDSKQPGTPTGDRLALRARFRAVQLKLANALPGDEGLEELRTEAMALRKQILP